MQRKICLHYFKQMEKSYLPDLIFSIANLKIMLNTVMRGLIGIFLRNTYLFNIIEGKISKSGTHLILVITAQSVMTAGCDSRVLLCLTRVHQPSNWWNRDNIGCNILTATCYNIVPKSSQLCCISDLHLMSMHFSAHLIPTRSPEPGLLREPDPSCSGLDGTEH